MNDNFNKIRKKLEESTGKTIQRAGAESTSKVNFYVVDKETGEILEAYRKIGDILNKYRLEV